MHHFRGCVDTSLRLAALVLTVSLAVGCSEATEAAASKTTSSGVHAGGSDTAPPAHARQPGPPEQANGPKEGKGPGEDQPPTPPSFPRQDWLTVVNNTYAAPGSTLMFNSYNQPSINANGQAVFRARTRGGSGSGEQRARGIYTCDMGLWGPVAGACPANRLEVVADATTLVPEPNNLAQTFIEFPSIPRIDTDYYFVSTRGQHEPVLSFVPEGATEEERVGTTGIYTKFGEHGFLETAASLVGLAPGYEYFAVPQPYDGYDPATDEPVRFNVFPGAPSPTVIDGSQVITFKGNYTDPTATENTERTGVYYRYVGGEEPVGLIANSDTPLPNPLSSEGEFTFGSTATPSAHDDTVVFVGYYIEEMPELGGGIYRATIPPSGPLETLVGVGDAVPGQPGATFAEFGEAVSFDGRYVAFWGAWGEQTRTLFLPCPQEGNEDRGAFCRHEPPYDGAGDGDPTTEPYCPAATPNCTDPIYGTTREVRVNQGIFVYDTLATSSPITMIAQTSPDASQGIEDFVYWNYSGAPPEVGTGGELEETEDREPPRFRASAFVATSSQSGALRVAFKGREADVNADALVPQGATSLDDAGDVYTNVTDSIYLGSDASYAALLSTGTDGTLVDPQAPEGSLVTELGLERDSLRGSWLVINAAMATEAVDEEEAEGMAGVYVHYLE